MFKIVPAPTFEAAVTIVSHGEEQKLNLTFRAKTAKEYQALLKSISEAKDVAAVMADVFLALVEKWDADAELGAASVQALNDHRPGALYRVIESYGENMIAARQGN